MRAQEREALTALRLDSASTREQVWLPIPHHVEGLHARAEHDIDAGIASVITDRAASPPSLVVYGEFGSGKTHQLAWVRQRIQQQGGYFFLVSLAEGQSFWHSVALSMFDGLERQTLGGETQLRTALRRLASIAGTTRAVRRAVTGDTALTRHDLDSFVEALATYDRLAGGEGEHTARALALLASADPAQQDVAHSFFASVEDPDPRARSAWGIRPDTRSADRIIRDLSRLLALTGPSIIAVDQIEATIAQSEIAKRWAGPQDQHQQSTFSDQILGGIVSLRENTTRTLTIVTCRRGTWAHITDTASSLIPQRFRTTTMQSRIPDAETGRAIVEKRLAASFAQTGFAPPYPTWPVSPAAFLDAAVFTPRSLLRTIDRHVRACLDADECVELQHLTGAAPFASDSSAVTSPYTPDDVAAIDARFAELQTRVDVTRALQPDSEDTTLPGLLSAGLTVWIIEGGDSRQPFTQDPILGSRPALHARLRRTLDEVASNETHWSFRGIATDQPRAALVRLRAAITAAGLTPQSMNRRLVLLRNQPWPTGPALQEALTRFTAAGGRVLPLADQDLRTLAAFQTLLTDRPPGLHAWIATRRPTRHVEIFRQSLGDADVDEPIDRLPTSATPDSQPSMAIGSSLSTGAPATISLNALRNHTVILAGSGSGKTMLVRRLVEQCALNGVSAILIDPNNDLARLDDPWPEAPSQWTEPDVRQADEYLSNSDVVVWTPGRAGGRPLHLPPLPDFASVLDDPDEFAEAVETVVMSIAPVARLGGKTAAAHRGQAVLRQTVEYYGRQGGNLLTGLIDLLAALPDDVSELSNAKSIAAGLAENLTAWRLIDPVFDAGTPVDPGLLLSPAAGQRARISVISMVGLVSDDQRTRFVRQLQMALFGWIKRNPSNGPAPRAVLVLENAHTFAPSGAMTASTRSTLALARQGRKYGLGLILTTDAPKALNRRVITSATTQFFGLLRSPDQIAAARDLMGTGGDLPDLTQLEVGQFYVAIDGTAHDIVHARPGLSHHTTTPFTEAEVIERSTDSEATP